MGELLSDVGDLVFSLVIGYIGALELLYVVRHLYHWSFRHAVVNEAENSEESLKHLQDNVRSQLAEAEAKESQAGGINAMQDGVLYKDGFRVEPQQQQEDKEQRRKEIEAELARQQKIEEETRAQLAKAEAELEKQRLEAAALAEQQEAEQKLLAAERAREEAQAEEERQRAEAEECAKRILEAEQQREAEQRQLEEEQELAAQREREELAKLEEQENAKRIFEAERLREETERLKEQTAEAERLAAEREQNELEVQRAREEALAEEERQRAEAEEYAKRILEAEQQREAEQRQLEEEQELAAQREREELAKLEEEENAKRILEAERLREETERLKEQTAEAERLAAEHEQHELEENIKRLLEAEQRQQEEQRAAEEAIERELLLQQPEYAELSEQALLLLEAEREHERKQKIKEENARKFLEAEEKMVAELQRQKDAAEAMQQQHISEQDILAELDRQMDAAEAMQKKQHTSEQDMLAELKRQIETTETMQQRQLPLSQQTSVIEEPCIKKNVSKADAAERLPQTVKTQFGQTSNESYSLTTKSLHFPGAADDASSVEPTSSQQSSFSTQPSDEITTGAEETVKAVGVLGVDIELEREAPDGEDTTPDIQYTDEYLRSLDGIKQRPLVREDGSGRRRAFKKRRSSGSSNSSRDSRVSREEEIKMFTSLEEEEMDAPKKGEEDFATIKYSGESTLKVKGHHRRHKRSPAKDAKTSDEKGSLEMLDEENSDPWGEVVPEHYKDTAFWKREKAMSIDEEEIDLEVLVAKRKEEDDKETEEKQTATHIPKASSFEDANDVQNKEALSALQQQHTEGIEEDSKKVTGETRGDENKNLNTSQNTEGTSSPARSTSPRLRRSPRIDEISQYEERWKETVDKATPAPVVTPSITLATAPWQDEHGLLMEGISDFYDFTASINPSRSRSTSRNPSRATTPTSPKTSTTFPKNISYSPHGEENNEIIHNTTGMVELYDDAGNFEIVNRGAVMEFVELLSDEPTRSKCFENAENFLAQNLKNIADEPEKRLTADIMPTILIESTDNDSVPAEVSRYLSRSRSRSRSRSPLPTADNIQRSLETRRSKLIQHNDEIFEKLKEKVPDIAVQLEQAPPMGENIKSDKECPKEDMNLLVDSIRAERCRSTSRSRSPLPTASNIQRSLETRREKLIQHNDEILQKLEQSQAIENKTVETPTISVQLVDSTANMVIEESKELSEEDMAALVETLRIARSRSHSKTPMRVEVKYIYEFVESAEEDKYKVSVPRPRSRSVTPSRSPIIVPVQEITSNDVPNESIVNEITDHPSPNTEEYVVVSPDTLENLSDYYDFHQMLNLEASSNKTLSKNTEEVESSLALKRRSVDEEALDKLRTANEEVELRTISPSYNVELTAEHNESENLDKFEHTIDHERLRQLKCTPTTPDYDRTISKEWEDVQRIKEEILTSGYKRSTYVGESLDIGSEYEDLRRQTAEFQRSQSRSRSPTCIETETGLIENARKKAADARQIQNDILAEITTISKDEESRGAKPKTSSYERSLSKEIVDTQRIKEAMLSSGFQRSTYVGESLDMSAQLEDLRRSAAEFRRSQSKSRSPPDARGSVEMARIDAEAARREFQDRLLDELERTNMNFQDFSRNLNADFLDSERRASDSILIQKPEIIFQFEDTDFSLDLEPEEYHHYRRYSLYQEPPVEEYPSDDYSDYMYVSDAGVFTAKETGSWIREDYECSDNFEHVNIEETNFEIASNLSFEVIAGTKEKENTTVLDELEDAVVLEESKAQEALQKNEGNVGLIEEKPNESNKEEREVASAPQEKVNDEALHADGDLTTCPDAEVHHAEEEMTTHQDDKDVNTIGEDEVAATLQENEFAAQADEDIAIFLEDEDTDDSEDERRTVVDVEDEIEEDIGDYNDRGPTDESHHEQSECEEADREMDRYADKRADDWQSIEDIDNLLAESGPEEEGATGGSASATYDSDSFAIDQIYDEAIRNRKQSGILRDYDCILQDMQKSFIENAITQNRELDSQLPPESDHYALWAKTRDLERSNSQRNNGVESSIGLIESERNDNERRYLGDATVSARSATRLRSRYGYVPVLQTNTDAEIEVDLNYKPKREYNWRKNFKLDEEEPERDIDKENREEDVHADYYETVDGELLDLRKYSLGGESITLFTRSPAKELLPEVVEEETLNFYVEQEIESTLDIAANEVTKQSEETEEKKQKTKKKSKKKTRKDSKGSINAYPKDDDDSENQMPYEYSRRSSSLQMDTDSPKLKSRSRRSSRSSLVNEDTNELFSPRSSIGYAEPLGEFNGEYDESSTTTSTVKKKTKKRKKAKETFMHEPEIKEEHSITETQSEILPAPMPVSAAISPDAASRNELAMLSPENSVCVTPASIESDTNINNESGVPTAVTTSSTTPSTTRSTINNTAARLIESFDILKDGNFYPLF